MVSAGVRAMLGVWRLFHQLDWGAVFWWRSVGVCFPQSWRLFCNTKTYSHKYWHQYFVSIKRNWGKIYMCTWTLVCQLPDRPLWLCIL